MSRRSKSFILCNGATLPEEYWEQERAGEFHILRLDYRSGQNVPANIKVELPNFVRGLSQYGVHSLAPHVLDLLEIAAYVFCADRSLSRGNSDAVEYHAWARSIHFVVKVRDAPFWEGCKAELEAALRFMSGDRKYSFTFQPGHETAPTSLFDKEDFAIGAPGDVSVVLFSGGLDSTAGIIELLETTSNQLCLVSHRSGQPRTIKTQNQLVLAFQEKYPNRISHFKFECHLRRDRADDETQRTRAFLYLSIAFALATAFSRHEFYVFENGVTAINFPKRQDSMNARASRTVHPQTIGLLGRFFTTFLNMAHGDSGIKIETPYLWKTKTDIFRTLEHFGQKNLISSTVSCSRTFQYNNLATHCGGCSQCVDRRLSSHAAGLSDVDDVGIYDHDFIQSSVTDTDAHTALLDYVRQAHRFATSNDDSFYQDMLPELVDLVEFIPGMDEYEVVQAIHQLCHRHGEEIFAGLKSIREKYDDLKFEVAPNTLLSMVGQKEYLQPVSTSLEQQSMAKRNSENLPQTQNITINNSFGPVAGQVHTGTGDIVGGSHSFNGAASTKEEFLAALFEFKNQIEQERQQGLADETADDVIVEIEAAEREANKPTPLSQRIIKRLETAKDMLLAGKGVTNALAQVTESTQKLSTSLHEIMKNVPDIFPG